MSSWHSAKARIYIGLSIVVKPPEGDMQRRGASGQPVKGERTKGPKARKAPTAQVSTADLQEQLDRRTRERDEALEQLAATSEVLQVISSSPGKLKPVFQAMLENALRICEAKFGTLYLCDGGALRPVADTQRAPPAYKEARKRKPRLPPAPDGSSISPTSRRFSPTTSIIQRS
jgi:hypothetical protein